MPLTPQEQEELAQLQAELGPSAMPDKTIELDFSNQQMPTKKYIDFQKAIVPKQAIDIISQYEGLKLKAYKDAVQKPTIGYGTTEIDGKPVEMGMTITKEKAEDFRNRDIEKFATGVQSLVKVPLSENQLSALTSFAYNVGLSNLENSTLLKKLNAGDYKSAANEMLKWKRAGKKVLKGLSKRREAERNLFLKESE